MGLEAPFLLPTLATHDGKEEPGATAVTFPIGSGFGKAGAPHQSWAQERHKKEQGELLTAAGGQHVTPLAVGQALRFGRALQVVASVAHKLGHVIQVELVALSLAIRRVTWVTAGDGCKEDEPIREHL